MLISIYLMGLVDWSGAQTSPIESFARPPVMIVPEPLKSRPWPLSAEEILRRELFFRIFIDCEVENHRQEDGISQVQRFGTLHYRRYSRQRSNSWAQHFAVSADLSAFVFGNNVTQGAI